MAAILRPIRQNCLTEHGSGHRARVMCAAGVVENDGKPKYALHAFRATSSRRGVGGGQKNRRSSSVPVKPFSKPAVDRSEKLAGFSALALFTP
jgi:hypothetical protein